jgi:hypothetical protein
MNDFELPTDREPRLAAGIVINEQYLRGESRTIARKLLLDRSVDMCLSMGRSMLHDLQCIGWMPISLTPNDTEHLVERP